MYRVSGIEAPREADIDAIRSGDRDALDRAVEPAVHRIYDIALTILGASDDAVEASGATIDELWARRERT